MHALNRVGLVALTAIVASLPATVISSSTQGSSMVSLTMYAAGAIGFGSIAAFFGGLVLIAARDRAGEGLKPALITTFVVAIIASYSTLRTLF